MIKDFEKINAVHTYWIFKNAIDKQTCQNIIELGKNKWEKGKVAQKNSTDKKTRNSDVAWTDDENLYNICWSFLNSANEDSNWNFKISACEPLQITRYKKKGHYDFHFDGNGFTRYNNPEDELLHGTVRKLSMTVVLNEDYEGGEFEFLEKNSAIKEKAGTVIVFPSYLLHRVKPITKGIRYSLVAWFCGEPFV
tara:strand:- start:1733 stop:2314 length:582 start_codon:yes stop_codon:yes gene_type:complete